MTLPWLMAITGCALIAVGSILTAMTTIQMMIYRKSGIRPTPMFHLLDEPYFFRLIIRTNSPGLMMIAIGAVLLFAATILG
jgi:hypothetical protein